MKQHTKSVFILIVAVTMVAAFSALAWVVPNLFIMNVDAPASTRAPLTAVQLEGRDIYIREGCNTCHTQMIRHDEREIARYGDASLPEHDVYEFPQLWGSKRTGPDLFRVGSKYSDEWHAAHLTNPRDLVPESTMPALVAAGERVFQNTCIACHRQNAQVQMMFPNLTDNDWKYGSSDANIWHSPINRV